MTSLNEASPAVQTTVAIAAVVVGAAITIAVANRLGRKFAAGRLESLKEASRKTLNNLKN